MSGVLNISSSGIETEKNNILNFCINKYGPEWDAIINEFKFFDKTYYLGKCVHKLHTGSNDLCCNSFLQKQNIFGKEGALNNRVTCGENKNSIITCNNTNKKQQCINQIKYGTVDNLCNLFIKSPGNNLELLRNDIIKLFSNDYNGRYNKYRDFMNTYIQLETVRDLDKIVKDNFDSINSKKEFVEITKKLTEKSIEISKRENKIKELDILIYNKNNELKNKNNLFNKIQNDLTNIKNSITLKEADLNKISGSIKTLEIQQNEMQASIEKKNELIKKVNDNIKQTQDKLNEFISLRDKLNLELNNAKKKSDDIINKAQKKYRDELKKLNDYEKKIREKLEQELADKKKKDIDELTSVFKSREAALEKNFLELKKSYLITEEKNKTESRELMNKLELKKIESENTVKRFNQQIIDKQNELNVIKKQKDDDIIKIQRETSQKIAKIREDSERENINLLQKFEEKKKKSIAKITLIYDKREQQISNKLNIIQDKLLKAEQDNKIRIQNMINEYEKKKNDYEKILLDEYKQKDISYKKMSEQREKQYQDELNKLAKYNEEKTKKINEEYNKKLIIIDKQKIDIETKFKNLKTKAQQDMNIITTKLKQERDIYNKEILRLNDFIKMKETETKQKILDIELSLQKDMKKLEATQELKKELLFSETNKQIQLTLDKLNNRKSVINIEFEKNIKLKQKEFDETLKKQNIDYLNKINSLKEANKNMVANLESLAEKYKLNQAEQNSRLNKLILDKRNEYSKIQLEYDKKANLEEKKFQEIVKKLEDDKFQTIKKFTKETQNELLKINSFLEEQKAKNKLESDKKRKELEDTLNKLENEKIELVKQKKAEIKKALDDIQNIYNSQSLEINKKIEEYNKMKKTYDTKIRDEMVIFKNQMKKLEEDKIKKVNDYTIFTQKELENLGKNLDKEKLKAKSEGLKYRKELEDTIIKLDKERMDIIKKKNDETANILIKIKQKYENQVKTINKSIKEYNEKKKNYDLNIKKIDAEQTEYVSKKRKESEQKLGKLSKILNDELDNLKNKIEEHKVQRNIKLKEINELNIKIKELQKVHNKDNKKIVTINSIGLIGLSVIVVILLIYIFYQKYNI